MRHAFSFLFACLLSLAAVTGQCTGCQYDNSGWEGTAGNAHKWEYNPSPLDAEGTCDPASCAWSPCAFKGTLTFTNNGAGAVQLHDPSGANLGVIAGNGGSWTSAALNIKGYCGLVDELDPWYGAHPVGGGARMSGYIFSCSACTA